MLRAHALSLAVILGMALASAAAGLAQTTQTEKQDQAAPAAQPTAPFMGNSDPAEGGTGKQDSETAPAPAQPPPEQPQQASPQAPAGQQLPSMGSASSPLPSRGYLGQPRERWNVFVIGDMLAEGVWGGLERAGADTPFEFNGRFKEDSGLARPEIYDWEKALPKILESNEVDVAVVIIGTNDGRPLKSADKSSTIPFGSPEWRFTYGAAVDRFMGILKSADIPVYWLGVPPMGSREHDAAVKIVNDVQRDRAAANGVRFLDFRKLFAGEDGGFVANITDEDGTVERLRSRDGINLLRAGNSRAATAVLAALNDDAAVANGEKAVADAPLPAQSGGVPIAADSAPAGPAFGSITASGDVRLIAPEDLPQKGLASVARGDVNTALEGVKSKLAPGTAAANLYGGGVWPEARQG
ncbi:MAG: DUF459 domain-containing protein, partial [Aestuariivirgaceae bacterium]